MSEAARPSAPSARRPARSSAPPPWPSESMRSEPATARPTGLRRPVKSPSPQQRLVALGVAEPTARALLYQHGWARVVDALDAVDTLGDGEVRRRAGWVVSAVRQGWDLEGLLAERRQLEARYARWEREHAERDRAAARWCAGQSRRWGVVLGHELGEALLGGPPCRVAGRAAASPFAGVGVGWELPADAPAVVPSSGRMLGGQAVLVRASGLEGPPARPRRPLTPDG
jgi:hypothetical protein